MFVDMRKSVGSGSSGCAEFRSLIRCESSLEFCRSKGGWRPKSCIVDFVVERAILSSCKESAEGIWSPCLFTRCRGKGEKRSL